MPADHRPLVEQVGNPDATYGPSFETTGWTPEGVTQQVVCKGCGPTLADRRMADELRALEATYGGRYAFGYDDPVVREYVRDEPEWVDEDGLPPTRQAAPEPRVQVAAVQLPVAAPAVAPVNVVRLAETMPEAE